MGGGGKVVGSGASWVVASALIRVDGGGEVSSRAILWLVTVTLYCVKHLSHHAAQCSHLISQGVHAVSLVF